MKKLLLSLSTITLLTAPLATVVACAAKSDDTTPETPPVGDGGSGGGDSDDGSGDGGSGGGDEGVAPEPDGLRPVMSEVELEAYLRERSFVIMGTNSSSSKAGMGSGWLFDESDDYWYVATNEHVTEVLKDSNDEVMITNDWDRMHQDYNLKDQTYNLTDGEKDTPPDSLVNPNNTAEITFLFNELRESETTSDTGKVIWEDDDITGVDFAIIQVPKVNSMIDPAADPIEWIPYDDYLIDYYPVSPGSRDVWVPTYTIGNGNYRYGSFFKDTYVTTHNTFDGGRAWSPTAYYAPVGESALIWGFDHGPGSSGSGSVDERGYFVMNQTNGFPRAFGASMAEAKADKSKYYHDGINYPRFAYWAEFKYTPVLTSLGESTIKYP